MKHSPIHSILALALIPIAPTLHGSENPNFIIIYSDDHGYTDLGAYVLDESGKTIRSWEF